MLWGEVGRVGGWGGWYQSMLCWLLPYSILLAKDCCAEAGAWRVSMEQEKATHTPEVSNFPPKRLLACLLRDHTSQWPLLTASPSNGSFHLYALKIDTLPRHVQHILWRIWYSKTYTWLWTDNNVQFKFICKTKCQSKKYKKSPEAGWCASETMNHKGIYPQQQRYPTIVVRDYGCLSMCQQTSPWIHAPRILTLCFHAFWIIASRIIIDLCIMDWAGLQLDFLQFYK